MTLPLLLHIAEQFEQPPFECWSTSTNNTVESKRAIYTIYQRPMVVASWRTKIVDPFAQRQHPAKMHAIYALHDN